jgi:sulfur relay (sulfurtransferase) DsrC/TusE family protein
MKQKVKVLLIISLLIASFLCGCSLNKTAQEERALFSWKDSEVLEGRTELLETMKELELNTVYQSFSKDLKEEDIFNFLEEATDKKLEVYVLTGSPEWALEEEGKTMIDEVEKAIKINEAAKVNHRVKGILFDVEPYLLDQWDNKKKRKEIMDQFIENMKVAYKKAHDNGLEVIACIPYYYDEFGFSSQVEELVKSGCDTLAIMNYYQGKEYEHIEKEGSLVAKYNKNLINIYEMKAPGEHGLIDKNTYFEEGITSVEENFISLKKAFSDMKLSIAFHDYPALKEVINRE